MVSSFVQVDAADLACAGAPGIIKPSLERLVYVTSPAVAELLIGLTDGLAAVAIAAFLGGKTYDLLNICSSPDPGDPGMSIDDWANAINYAEPLLFIPAQAKARQWLLHQLWPTWCNCSNGTAPPPNTTTAPPGQQGNPNIAPTGIGANCWDHSATSQPIPNGWDLSYMNVFPQIPTNVQKTPPPQGIQSPIPAGFTVTITAGNQGSNPLGVSGNLNVFDSTGTLIAANSPAWSNVAPGTSHTTPFTPLSANASAWNMALFNVTGGGALSTNTATVELTIYCQGQSPTSVISPCCPPDDTTQNQLGAIMDMLTQLLSLQQLQGAYVDSVRHAGLSGEGTIAINPASSAIRVEITSDLTSWPHNPQVPNYYYSLGFITPYAVGTPLRGQRLIYQHQTYAWPSYTDTIGYTLETGVTADLVELTQGAT